jgi:hypothetical protein
MGYSAELANVYDLIFGGRGKDYDGEAAEVVRQVRRRFSGRTRCWTWGAGPAPTLVRFCEVFDQVEGVEPSPAMRRLAEMKLPSVRIHGADMRELRLDRGFDARSLSSSGTSSGHHRSTLLLGRWPPSTWGSRRLLRARAITPGIARHGVAHGSGLGKVR